MSHLLPVCTRNMQTVNHAPDTCKSAVAAEISALLPDARIK
ncbi:Unknown protein sequence [Pseudomonas amygdali pv. myricae]|nr:Unknown protein sequence [Pseudomonas amygdali pv. myricae]